MRPRFPSEKGECTERHARSERYKWKGGETLHGNERKNFFNPALHENNRNCENLSHIRRLEQGRVIIDSCTKSAIKEKERIKISRLKKKKYFKRF